MHGFPEIFEGNIPLIRIANDALARMKSTVPKKV
jgi:hypothetical protein